MTTEGNSICFSSLNDLRTIPSILTEILENKNYEYKYEQKHISVKGKLEEKYKFWKNTIKANETFLQIVEEGYMLSFIETPSGAKSSDNKSTLTSSAFAQEAIEDMLLSGTIKQVKIPPKVINPQPHQTYLDFY